jgi:hypothetical protein
VSNSKRQCNIKSREFNYGPWDVNNLTHYELCLHGLINVVLSDRCVLWSRATSPTRELLHVDCSCSHSDRHDRHLVSASTLEMFWLPAAWTIHSSGHTHWHSSVGEKYRTIPDTQQTSFSRGPHLTRHSTNNHFRIYFLLDTHHRHSTLLPLPYYFHLLLIIYHLLLNTQESVNHFENRDTTRAFNNYTSDYFLLGKRRSSNINNAARWTIAIQVTAQHETLTFESQTSAQPSWMTIVKGIPLEQRKCSYQKRWWWHSQRNITHAEDKVERKENKEYPFNNCMVMVWELSRVTACWCCIRIKTTYSLFFSEYLINILHTDLINTIINTVLLFVSDLRSNVLFCPYVIGNGTLVCIYGYLCTICGLTLIANRMLWIFINIWIMRGNKNSAYRAKLLSILYFSWFYFLHSNATEHSEHNDRCADQCL